METDSAFHLTGIATTIPTPRSLRDADETQLPSELGGDLAGSADLSPKAPLTFAFADKGTEPKTAFADKWAATAAFADRPGVKTYEDWDQRAVSSFVATSCDLPQYERTIKANKITGSQLRELRSRDLLNMGLLRAGITDHDHQRRISEEMLRVEQGDPDSERLRLSKTEQAWNARRALLPQVEDGEHLGEFKHVRPRAGWDVKRRELSFGRLTTCYMPGKKDLPRGRFMYGPRLELTRTAKLMKKESSCPAQLFSSETRKTMQLYDPHRHSKMAGAAASSKGIVKLF